MLIIMQNRKIIEKWLALEIAIPRNNNEMFPKRVRIIFEGLYLNRYGYVYNFLYYINCDTREKIEIPKIIRILANTDGTVDNYGLFYRIKDIFPDIYMKTKFKTHCYDYTTQMINEFRKKKLMKIRKNQNLDY